MNRLPLHLLILFVSSFLLSPSVQAKDFLESTQKQELARYFQDHPSSGGLVLVIAKEKSNPQLLHLKRDLSSEVISSYFFAAKDPSLSFDANRLLFSAKTNASAAWQIFEYNFESGTSRQITRNKNDSLSPIYLSSMYVITSPQPWNQIAFVKTVSDVVNLWTVLPDGSRERQITFNPFGAKDPFLMDDGRILFSGWKKERTEEMHGDRLELFAINMDGTDLATFSGHQGKSWMRAAKINEKGKTLFIEGTLFSPMTLGSIASLDFRRNLHSYRTVPLLSDQAFYSLSPTGGKEWLVSRKGEQSGRLALYRWVPGSENLGLIVGLENTDVLEGLSLFPRHLPDGRSSVVKPEFRSGKLYALNIYLSQMDDPQALPKGSVKSIHILSKNKTSRSGLREISLGTAPVANDGSFNVEVPAEVPLKVQAIDHDGKVLRSCSWIWVMPNEPRGCIGCHEKGERTPPNVMAEALRQPAAQLLKGKVKP